MRQGLLIMLSFAIISLNVHSQVHVDYQSNEAAIFNPERGFYRHTETNPANYSFLNQSSLESYKENGFSLILRVFYLSTFLESEISEEYLENMQEDFNVARRSGVKIILRLAYTKKSSSPYNDATLDRVKIHLQQLKPLIHSNADVIAVVQAGLIGAWGEWYYTDHFSEVLGNPSEEDWNKRRELVENLLDAVPESRFVQVRTPDIKMNLTERFAPITEAELGSGSMASRLGHHNDCFLASPNDVGTYRDSSLEKPYLEEETRFLPIGGETCGVYAPLSECANTVKQMKRFHWSYINNDYHPDVISNWKNEGCYNEIEKLIGYRYRLLSSDALSVSKPAGIFNLSIDLINDGWANVYNARQVEIILRHSESEKEYILVSTEDPRIWPLRESHTITFEGGLPANIPSGEYQVFLNLPDPEISLRNNPDYSIQMANNLTWESSTGYNNLNYTIDIDQANTAVEDYTGDQFFLLKNEGPSEDVIEIIVDGDASDWLIVNPDHSDEDADLTVAKTWISKDTLFFLAEGSSLNSAHQLFLNADDAISGYSAWQWDTNGADYLVENNLLYTYNGTDHAWGWEEVGEITLGTSGQAIEIGIPISMLNATPLDNEFSYAHINDPLAVSKTSYLPLQGALFIKAVQNLQLKGPLFSTSYGNGMILYWPEDSSNIIRVLERSHNNGDFSQLASLPGSTISYRDGDLSTGDSYKYRMYATDGLRYSTFSETVTFIPDGVVFPYPEINIDAEAEDWNSIEPVSVVYENGNSILLKGFKSPQNISFLIQGAVINDYLLYLNTDGDPSSGYMTGKWKNEGFDLKISNDSIFNFHSELWSYDRMVEGKAAENDLLELQFPIGNYLTEGISAAWCGLIIKSENASFLPLLNTESRAFSIYSSAVVPADFTVRRSGTLPKSRVVVEWENDPRNKSVVIERAEAPEGPFEFIAEMSGNESLYRDEGLEESTHYYYRIYAYNGTGRSEYSEVRDVATLETEAGSIQETMHVYPTLIAESALLEFFLNSESQVKASLYNSAGQEITVLVNEYMPSGNYSFRINRANNSSGIYLLKITTTSGTISKKLIFK